MLRQGRALTLTLALVAACASETFDLLGPGAAGRGGTGGTGGGAGTGGSGGSGGATGGGAVGGRFLGGGTGGTTPSGGTGGLATGGSFGGAADGGQSGEDNAGGAGSDDCTLHEDCAAPTPYCVPVRNSNLNHCVACVSGADCGPGENCNFLTNACAPVCFSWEQCPSYQPFCERELGVCVECMSDLQCGDDVCEFGECVECRSAFDCPLNAPVCDTSNTCRPCTGMFQCGQYRYCDIATGRCEALNQP